LQAYARTFYELTCADIMSRSLVAVSAVTRASAAWSLLKQRRIKTLPVTDEKQHVTGIVTRADLVDKRAFSKVSGLSSPVQHWFRRSITPAPLVGALMNVDVHTVDATTPIVELVPVFANYGHHHIPVLDANRRLAGMITQADPIAGLHRQPYAQQQHAA
jgi:CBS domain-containing membrane protein